MTFETAMLKTFFVAGVLTCLLMLGAFVASPANQVGQVVSIAAAR